MFFNYGCVYLCMLPLAQFCGHTIMSLFTNEVEVISIGVRALKLIAVLSISRNHLYYKRAV